MAPVALTTIGGALDLCRHLCNAIHMDRWWRAGSWGPSRSKPAGLARLARRHIAVEVHDDVAWRIAARCIAFGHLARDLLRGDLPAMQGCTVSEEERALIRAAGSPPYGVLDAMSRDLADVAAANRVASSMLFAMEERGRGPVPPRRPERIRATPVPFAYTLLLHRTAYLFCFFFALRACIFRRLRTPLHCAHRVHLRLDAMGQNQRTVHALFQLLPLDAIARAIDIGVRGVATVLPAAPTPIRHFLA